MPETEEQNANLTAISMMEVMTVFMAKNKQKTGACSWKVHSQSIGDYM